MRSCFVCGSTKYFCDTDGFFSHRSLLPSFRKQYDGSFWNRSYGLIFRDSGSSWFAMSPQDMQDMKDHPMPSYNHARLYLQLARMNPTTDAA